MQSRISNDGLRFDVESPIGVIGLGLMGTAITERILEAGYEVYVWNRTREKADPLLALGARWSDCPFEQCSRVIISLYSSEVVKGVLEAWCERFLPGQVVIDTTTGDPIASQGFALMLERSHGYYLEAPISGSSQQTREGQATVIAAGDFRVFDACWDIWEILGRETFYLGSSGNAAKMKLVSNLVLGLNRAVLAEGLALAEALEIDLNTALEVLRCSGAYSKQMDTKGLKMAHRQYSVQARLSQHLKDVLLMLHSAGETGLKLPLSETHRSLLEQAQVQGLGDLDNSAIFEVLRRSGG
jgi:3-hydroxyisobutyrate dehydrogenase-like beta-hydroxyacid dehydrogenase